MDAWRGFKKGNWSENIDTRDFIQLNYTPYEGDESFLAEPTERTKNLWKYLRAYLHSIGKICSFQSTYFLKGQRNMRKRNQENLMMTFLLLNVNCTPYNS